MVEAVQFTPIYGARGRGPLCCRLSVGPLVLLLDCGWTDMFDPADLHRLRPVAADVDAVLISHPDVLHLGALPYAQSKLGLRAPVVCTAPAHRLGKMLLYDHYLSRQSVSNFALFNLDDIDAVFENAVLLKYCEPHTIGRKGGPSVAVTPLPCGPLVGSCGWKITIGAGDLLYAPGFNHRSERLLNGAALERLVRPRVMVADASSALAVDQKRKHRDAELGRAIQNSFERGGSVLMPVEATGRVLELMVFLDEFWAANALGSYGLVLLTHQSTSVVECAKGLLEWLSDAAVKSFEEDRINPFNFRFLKLCRNVAEMEDAFPGQKMVLASPASLSSGYSRTLFAQWASDARNTVLFTAHGPEGSLAHSLQTQDAQFSSLQLVMSSKDVLEGQELEAFEAAEQEKRKEEKQAEKPLTRINAETGVEGVPSEGGREVERRAADVSSGEPGSESFGDVVMGCEGEILGDKEEGQQGDFTAKPLLWVSDTPPGARGDALQQPCRVLEDAFIEGFEPALSAAGQLFPSQSTAKFYKQMHSGRWDEYGEIINPDDFKASTDGILLKAANQRQQVLSAKSTAADEFRELVARIESPSRVAEQKITLTLAASVKFLDYEGLSDGRALVNVIQRISPNELIFVHGSDECTSHLQQACAARRVCCGSMGGISCPAVGETVDLTKEFAALQFQLSDDLISSGEFKMLPGALRAVWVEGLLREAPHQALENSQRPLAASTAGSGSAASEGGSGQPPEPGRHLKSSSEEGRGASTDSGGSDNGRPKDIDVAVSCQRSMMLLHSNTRIGCKRRRVMLGDSSLPDFRILLQAHGIAAEFRAETMLLSCGGNLTVRKMPNSDTLVVEGTTSTMFYKIRKLLYSRFVAL